MHQFECKLPSVHGFLAFQTWIYLVKWLDCEVREFKSTRRPKISKNFIFIF